MAFATFLKIHCYSASALIALAAALLFAAPASAAAQTFTENGAALIGTTVRDSRSASLADIDNDGDLDILFQGSVTARRLFRNNTVGLGENSFTNITTTHGPSASDTTGWSAAWGDYDGDGDVDVFLGETNAQGARGDLFRNDGAAGFTDVSAATINDPGFHQNVGWVDIDNDGDLDLMIAMEGPERHEIYIQNENGTFTAVGEQAGFQVDYGTKSYGMAIGDTDEDGDLDIYISTCRDGGNIRNNFFENQLIERGELFFDDIADTNSTQYMDNSYGSEFVDFDDDGDLDLYMTGADGNPSKIWRNDGGGGWTDVDTITTHPLLSNQGTDLNGSRAVDYDNDGDLDLFFHDHLAGALNQARLLYRNDGGWAFTDVTTTEGLATTARGAYDSTWGDYDLDGDQDLIAPTDFRQRDEIFVSNASANGNGWLYIWLRASAPNTRGLGARLYATLHAGTPGERTLRRDMNTNANTFNQSDVPVHFGLGPAEKVDRLRVVWPGGEETILEDIDKNQYITVTLDPPPPLEESHGWSLY